MLGEHAIGYVGGAGSCSGCGEATAIRMLVAATRQVHGPESMGIVAATGCNTVFGSTYPFNPYLVPWTNSLFENAPADRARHPRALGPGRSPRAAPVGHGRRRRDVRHRLPVAVPDGRLGRRHQGAGPRHAGLLEHRWPGIDRVVRRPGHQASAFGKAIHGRPERRKELGRILLAHGEVYVAQTTPAHINHFYRAVMEANEYPGPRGRDRLHAVPAGARHRRRRRRTGRRELAVDRGRSRCSPTTRGAASRSRSGCRSRATRPSSEDWATLPGRDAVDFLAFARTEGRFAPHFGADGRAERGDPGHAGGPAGELARAPGTGGHPMTFRRDRRPASARVSGATLQRRAGAVSRRSVQTLPPAAGAPRRVSWLLAAGSQVGDDRER